MEKYKDSSAPVEERVEDLLSRMTLEEKAAQMDMIRGVELAERVHEAHFCAVDPDSDFQWDKVDEEIGTKGIGFVHDVYSVPKVLNKLQHYMVEKTRLGIPCIFTGEALHGISFPGAQVFPSPITLGAMFDPEMTEKVGHGIAAETKSLGIDEILAPNLDVAREPRWGRVEETFGEDTYLSSQNAYAIVHGEQGDDVSAEDRVLAEPKHFVAHGFPEGGINCAPARAGLREVETSYLPVFEAGIRKAGAVNVMASYNCIDAETVIDSRHYLTDVLRKRFGLKGYVRADFGAVQRLKSTHHCTDSDCESIRRAVEAGLDVQGFDFSCREWESTLIDLVRSGDMKEEVIDRAVRRILRVKFMLGLFEHPYTDEERYKSVIRCREHAQIAREAATEGAVLLKNDGGALPLSGERRTIAVLGPSSAHQRIGSYSSVPYGYGVRSIAEVLAERFGGKAKIVQIDGCPVTDLDVDLIPKRWYPDGVKLEFFEGPDFDGKKVGEDRQGWIKYNWILAKPHRNLPFRGYGVRMSARMRVNTADFSGSDRFRGKLVFKTGDSVRVYLDGRLVIDSWGDHKMRIPSVDFEFIDGKEYDLRIEFWCDVNGNDIRFAVGRSDDSYGDAVAAAGKADAVILVCGDDTVTAGEGMDRDDLRLYGKQEQLIHDCAAAAHRNGAPVILVLENGKPVDLTREVEDCDAILETWFGGEYGAEAAVDLLLGVRNPSGKLPISFPTSVKTLPAYYSMLPGKSGEYLEGVPIRRFAFGFGLSYTTFEYTDLTAEKTGDCDFTVRFKVKNTGKRVGTEVAQLYVTDPVSSVVTPDILLQGFQRVTLQPGEEKEVEMKLGFDNFRLLDRTYRFVVEKGDFIIQVGSGSTDLRLKTMVTVDRDIEGESVLCSGTDNRQR